MFMQSFNQFPTYFHLSLLYTCIYYTGSLVCAFRYLYTCKLKFYAKYRVIFWLPHFGAVSRQCIWFAGNSYHCHQLNQKTCLYAKCCKKMLYVILPSEHYFNSLGAVIKWMHIYIVASSCVPETQWNFPRCVAGARIKSHVYPKRTLCVMFITRMVCFFSVDTQWKPCHTTKPALLVYEACPISTW